MILIEDSFTGADEVATAQPDQSDTEQSLCDNQDEMMLNCYSTGTDSRNESKTL